MRIRSRRLIRVLAWLAAASCRLLFRTVRIDVRFPPGRCAYMDTGDERYLYCLWHDAILGNIFSGPAVRIAALVSRHADGDYIADCLDAIGVPPIRGSSRRGGAEALRQMMDAARDYHIAIATDGPQGPRHVVKDGIVYLASQTGRGIIPVAFAARNAWHPRGRWTDMTVPKPLTRAWFHGGEPIYVPPGLSREQLEPYRARLQRAMEQLEEEVQRLARGEQGGESREQDRRAA